MKTLVAMGALLLSPMLFAQSTPARRRAIGAPAQTPTIVHRTVTLAASKDNTLYETTDGSVSNAKALQLFAGRTAQGSLRRALVAFDIPSQIPAGSQITRVVLTLTVTAATTGQQPMALHRVTADWGEGTSKTSFGHGQGTSSTSGDATWIHTFFSNKLWTKPGGDFDATPDATVTAGSVEYRWESPAMITRVQQWLDQPATNFGWIVIGNESTVHTAKAFNSRELTGTASPALLIEFDTRQ